MFCTSSGGDLVVPEGGLIRFVDAFTGELLYSSLQDCLQDPRCILRNEFNNVSGRQFKTIAPLFCVILGLYCSRQPLHWPVVQV